MAKRGDAEFGNDAVFQAHLSAESAKDMIDEALNTEEQDAVKSLLLSAKVELLEAIDDLE